MIGAQKNTVFGPNDYPLALGRLMNIMVLTCWVVHEVLEL